MCNNCQNSTEEIYYQSQDVPSLENLNLGNGTYLNEILKKIDSILGAQYAFNFTPYTMPYLKGKYTINTMKNFAESTSVELDLLNKKATSLTNTTTSLTNSNTAFNTRITNVEFPKIADTANAGFTTNDGLKVVLQKLTNRVGNIVPVKQEALVPVDSQTVLLTTSGVLGHTLGASVKISSTNGNRIVLNNDGLFVAPVPALESGAIQTLSLNGYTLGISSGNFVNLPIPQLTLSGTTLGIQGSNSVDIGNVLNVAQTPIVVNDSSTIDFTASGINNHTITAQVKISSNAGNQLVNANGLFVPNVNVPTLLSDISLTPAYKTSFCGIVASCSVPLSFTFTNSGGVSVAVNYIDVNNVSRIINVAASFSVSATDVKKIVTPSTTTLKIEFLGFT